MKERLNNFGRIGVLMGGPSSEREISLKSGRAVCDSLKKQNLDTVAIDIETDDRQQNCKLIRTTQIDVAFIALHGCFGEDGQIQALLEELEMPYTGSGPAASRLAMDKIASRKIFQKQGLPVPNYVIFSIKDCGDLRGKVTPVLTQPFVVKPAAQGSSIGLSIAGAQEELEQAAKLAFKFDERIIVEEYIPGREITVGVLGDSALPVVEIIPQNKFYDYEAKYTPGKSEYVVPASLPAQITAEAQRVALSAHRALGCFGFSRVDMRLSPGNIPFILEVNSIPGLTEASLLPKAAAASGISFDRLCLHILRLACERSLAV
ncbi:MAG: D-alanine--D-alanine ligase [Candidatus Omnitrophota bacterium]